MSEERRERWRQPLAASPWPVVLCTGDAVAVAHTLLLQGVRADLVYLDPPFSLGRDLVGEVVAPTPGGDARWIRWGFGDRWPGGLEGYLAAMEPVLHAVRALLAPGGSLLLHCDQHAAPYLAVACDRIFGFGDRLGTGRAAGFRNELVWLYGLGGSSSRSYPRKHDTILWYTAGGDWFFEPPREPATSQRLRGTTKKSPDVIDIPAINNMAVERTGFPTQKPLALLDRLVRAHAAPGATIVDLFGGSGTTSLAAGLAGRRAVSGDQSADAVALQRFRLLQAGLDVDATLGRADVGADLRVVDGVVELASPVPLVFAAAMHRAADGALEGRHWWWCGGRASGGRWEGAQTHLRLQCRPDADYILYADAAGRETLSRLTTP